MTSEIIIGYDPGGNDAHGVAMMQLVNGALASLQTKTRRTVEEVIRLVESAPETIAIGIDTLTCWSTGGSAWRPADRWLRKQYPEIRNSIVSPNGLFGSMGLNGMAVVAEARRQRPSLMITETHPKVLCWKLFGKKYDYAGKRDTMHRDLAQAIGLSFAPETEHEWDAAISAFAAYQAICGRWTVDLHKLPAEVDERMVSPCGPTNYFWPD